MPGRDNDVFVLKGGAEFSRAIGKVQSDLPKEMQRAFKAIADHVVGVAQQRMPHVSGVAQKSLKPRGSGGRSFISFPAGGPLSRKDKDGYYPWLDFGGGQAGARGITSSSPVAHARNVGGFKRPVVKGGRYLYPAIAESTEYVGDEVDKALKRLIVRAGFDTSGHADG